MSICASSVAAQGTKSDYERARGLRQKSANTVFKTSVRTHWFDNNNRFWYRNSLAGGASEFVLVDAQAGVRQVAFQHDRLAAALEKASGKKIDPKRLPFDRIQFSEGVSKLHFSAEGKHWTCDLTTYTVKEGEPPKKPAVARKPTRESRPRALLPPVVCSVTERRMDGVRSEQQRCPAK